MKLKQRQNHEKLAMGKSIPLSSNCKYYLLPSSWLSKWRSYITASSKNASSMEPEILDGIINLLKCEKVTYNFSDTSFYIFYRHCISFLCQELVRVYHFLSCGEVAKNF